ncbi:MAG TPA: large conductance mechanosensitive channel protein MscL [Acidimicrobiales bacterium]|jgi:large conductance mechanosensitive channel|nr:large conductance mechanosensitive channel protein MscL [Acidimicrobiales bacterium]
MLKDFKAFVLRGNVVDLAIAVVIGAAFGAVVTAFVKDIVTPLISIPGKADFQNLTFTINGSVFRYGDFINVVIAFVSIAAAVFFLVVKPVNRMRGVKPDAEADMRECPECLTSVPAAAHRCAACTTKLTPATAA